MNTVVNQLVKEAAYHAAKYDSTIQAINALAQNGMNKTAGFMDDLSNLGNSVSGMANMMSPGLVNELSNDSETLRSVTSNLGDQVKDMIGSGSDAIANMAPVKALLTAAKGAHGRDVDAVLNGIGNPFLAQSNPTSQHADLIKSMFNAANTNPSTSPMAISALTNKYNALSDIVNSAPANPGVVGEMAGNLGASDLVGALGIGAGAAGLGAMAKSRSAQQAAAAQAAQQAALKNQLAAANADNGSLLSNLGQRLRNAGSSAWEAIKANPGTAAAVGLGGAGLAALPFLMGGEKEGSYDPYKLQVLRSVLSGM